MFVGWVGGHCGRFDRGVAHIQGCVPESSEPGRNSSCFSVRNTQGTREIVATNRLVVGDQYFDGSRSE